MPPSLGVGIDNWFDPNLLECLCFRCQRGGRCASMRELHQSATDRDDRRAKLACLTDDDRAWLAAHGWTGQ